MGYENGTHNCYSSSSTDRPLLHLLCWGLGSADFIALHRSGDVLRVQLKSRLTFEKKYEGNGLHVAFAVGETWYLYPHDELLSQVLNATNIGATESWGRGGYSFPRLSKQLQEMLAPYCITGDTRPLPE